MFRNETVGAKLGCFHCCSASGVFYQGPNPATCCARNKTHFAQVAFIDLDEREHSFRFGTREPLPLTHARIPFTTCASSTPVSFSFRPCCSMKSWSWFRP